ncbi:30S ribosomal protein S4e [Halalkalicoccus sp. NIPERK01]|uniref:30S ribosomal protein S4e n=1 Tax=Halalkalicoccus sp. NIPERK01 TaxID=3053469 RepID=UPI00256F19AA|nr:30S ribosomal protein S4e [Halalkalicoccus sp. NIPERK01]MDL5362526.1 30S ribosomal protein S4e [Halalkalicoccus sp. NIPERK01]
MSRHQKRLSVPDSWPVERKTAKYTVKARAGPHGEAGVPLLIVLRDVLGYVDSTKEAKYATNEGNVLVNGEPVGDVRRPIGMFDILGFEEREEFYRVFPDEGGRLALTPIDEADADGKLGKIADKRQVPGGETQLQLHDGRNLRVDDGAEYSPGDSIVIDWDGEILAHFVYEEGALVTAVQGQHAGEVGEIEEITVIESSAPNTVSVDTDDGSFETIDEYVVVIDENFVGGDAGTASEEASGDSREDEGGAEE